MTTTQLAEAIRNSIEVEHAAERFYRLLAESTDDMESKKFLVDIAAQEAEHAARVEALGIQLNAGELPRYAAAVGAESVETSPDWAFVDGIGLEDALALALQNEEHAALFYSALADGTEGALSEFFFRLAKDEEHHIDAVRARIARLAK